MDVKINYNELDKTGKTAVIYARYSAHGQREQSIEGQLAEARKHAADRGYTIIREYIDRAMTGRNDNREAFQKMLSDCAKRQFQVIIVWKVDRFGRNREEITFNKYRAKKHGVRVEYVSENLPDSPEAVILESVLEGMAEYYSLQLSQNIRRGYRENAKKCKYAGGRVPLGYKLTEEKTFEIDPKTSPVVRTIFEMYCNGQTITEIIKHLNAQGLRTVMGVPFTKNSLRTVLKNEKYIGVYDYKGGEIRIEGGVPAIIEKEAFYKAQELLKTNKRAPAHKWSRADYLLTDKLFCGKCGGAMVGESGTSKNGTVYNYYLCTTHKRQKTCDRKAIRQDWLEDFVIENAKRILTDGELIENIVEDTWQYYLAQDQQQEDAKILQSQLSDVNKAIANLMKAIEAGVLNDTIKARLNELEEQQTALKSAIGEFELKQSFRLTKEYVAFFFDQFKYFDYTDRKCQQKLVDVFVNSIYVYDDRITANYNFDENNSTITFTDMEKLRAGECSYIARSVPPKKNLVVNTITGFLLFIFSYRKVLIIQGFYTPFVKKCCFERSNSTVRQHFLR